MMGFRPADERCEQRTAVTGVVGPHATQSEGSTGVCIYCGASILAAAPQPLMTPPIPTVTKVEPMTEQTEQPQAEAKEIVPDVPWRPEDGLINGILDQRRMPPNSKDIYRFLGSQDFADGYQAGIDTALDLLVPALKAIVLQPPFGGAGSYSKSLTDKVIGRVPLRRTPFGWE